MLCIMFEWEMFKDICFLESFNSLFWGKVVNCRSFNISVIFEYIP
jgi:hypothetical protein